MGFDNAFHSKLYHEAEESRTLKSNEVECIVDVDQIKQSKNILNLSKLYEDNIDKNEAETSNSDKMIHDIESSDSQFLRDCESVFTGFTEDVCR